jgi:hypothetical protein
MDAARDDGERTEAHTYVGLSDLHAGRVAEAKAHFTWVKDRGTRTYAEYELAKQTLARLERDTRKDPGDLSNMRDGP